MTENKILFAVEEPNEMTEEARAFFSALGRGMLQTFGEESLQWTLNQSGLFKQDEMTFIVGYSRQMVLPTGSTFTGKISKLKDESIFEFFYPFPIDGSKIGGFYVLGTHQSHGVNVSSREWVKTVMKNVLPTFVNSEPNLYGVKVI